MTATTSTATVSTVYRRTAKGQSEALAGARSELPADLRRLLLLVNGYTPVSIFAALAGFDAEAESMVETLKTSGLIESADIPVERAKLSNLCGSHCH